MPVGKMSPSHTFTLLVVGLGAAHGFRSAAPPAALSLSRRAAAVSSLPSSTAATAALAAPCRRASVPTLLADDKKSALPFFLDPNTKGGIIFWSIVGIVLPFVAYSFMLDNLGWDVVLAGNVILVGYVGLGTVVWTGSYVFRVANKDMTYAQQLKDYENAVIQKRFEELSEEEVDALMGEIYPSAPEKKP